MLTSWHYQHMTQMVCLSSSNLNLTQLIGENDLENNYIEFSPIAQTPYEGVLYFRFVYNFLLAFLILCSVPSSTVVAATLNINYRASIWESQVCRDDKKQIRNIKI